MKANHPLNEKSSGETFTVRLPIIIAKSVGISEVHRETIYIEVKRYVDKDERLRR